MCKVQKFKNRIIKEYNLSFDGGTLLNVCRGLTHAIIESSYICSRGELNTYLFVVKNPELEDELERIKNNSKKKGVKINYTKYEELIQSRILKYTNALAKKEKKCK